jgi:hypothetical protein
MSVPGTTALALIQVSFYQAVDLLENPGRAPGAWLPGPFIPAEITTVALERIRQALAPGRLANIRSMFAAAR